MAHYIANRLAHIHSRPKPDGHYSGVCPESAERLSVAISAQTGSGAQQIATCLTQYLQAHAAPQQSPWRVFDRNLITKVLEDHHLPAGLARVLREDASNAVDEFMDELFGLRPPSWKLVQQSAETMLKLVRDGHVVLVGWGASAVTQQLPNVFQVRLVGSLDKRITRIQERDQVSRKEALATIERSDRGRARYMKRHFNRRISEVLLYDLTVNTDRLSEAEAALWIGSAALLWHRSNAIKTSRPPEPELYV